MALRDQPGAGRGTFTLVDPAGFRHGGVAIIHAATLHQVEEWLRSG